MIKRFTVCNSVVGINKTDTPKDINTEFLEERGSDFSDIQYFQNKGGCTL